MQSEMLSCEEARRQMSACPDGPPSAALVEHLSRCEPCLEACLDAALARPPEVRVPEHFKQRLLARLPDAAPAEMPEYPWLPVAASILCEIFLAALWWSGDLARLLALLDDAVRRPAVLLAIGAAETVLSLLWFWQVWSEDH
jgi:hypothetical protein